MTTLVATPHPGQTASRPTAGLLSLGLLALTGVGLVLTLWLRLHQPPNTVDDAYITFRYARNLITGQGFVYTPGEHVLGTTTPAYTLLLAATAIASGDADFPRLAVWLNALLDAVSFALLLRIGARLSGSRWVGVLAAFALGLNGRLLDFSTGGMESAFNVTVLLGCLVCALEGRSRWAAALAGLAVLIRPDGATLAAALGLVLVVERVRAAGWKLDLRNLPWAELAVILAVVVPWVALATWYFGHPIPQSVLAKSEVYRLEDWIALRSLLVQLRLVLPFSLPPVADPEPFWRQALQAILPASLVGLGIWAGQRRNPRAWILAVYIPLFILFFSVGNPLWLGWYEIPLEPIYAVCILTGVVGLVDHWPRHGAPGASSLARPGPLVALLVAVMLYIPQLSRLNALPGEQPLRPAGTLNAMYNKERERDYWMLAEMLAPAAAAGRQIAIPEIGAFGYAYPGRVLDVTGLVSPEVMAYFPVAPEVPVVIYTVPRQLVLDLKPEWFISFDDMIQADLRPAWEDFQAVYRPAIGMVSRAAAVNQRLVAYQRRDLPLSDFGLPTGLTRIGWQYDEFALEGYATRFGSTRDFDYLELTLVWRAGPQTPSRERLVRVDLLDRDGAPAFQILNYPGEAMFPTTSWAPGMIVVDRYWLKLDAEPIGPLGVDVAVLDDATGDLVNPQNGSPLFSARGIAPP